MDSIHNENSVHIASVLTVSTPGRILPGMARASYHHGDLRRALADAAMTALDRDGQLPSWRALARACGVSQSAPYRHFESADALKAAVAAEGFRQLAAEIRRVKAAHEDPRAAFEAGFRAYVRFGRTRSSLYAVMFSSDGPAAREQEGSEAARDAFSTLVDAVAACGVRDPFAASFVLWTGHHGLVEILRLGLATPDLFGDPEQLVARTATMLLAYLDSLTKSEPAKTGGPRKPSRAKRSSSRRRGT